jgi:hypothetical protein
MGRWEFWQVLPPAHGAPCFSLAASLKEVATAGGIGASGCGTARSFSRDRPRYFSSDHAGQERLPESATTDQCSSG